MASNALYAPAHRVMARTPLGGGEPVTIAPSADAVFTGIQDARWPWKRGASDTAPEVVMLAGPSFPLINWAPSAASSSSIAPLQIPVAGKPLTLHTPATAGPTVAVSTVPITMFSAGSVAPVGTVFLENLPQYRVFGAGHSRAYVYPLTSMLGRGVSITSVANATGTIAAVSGVDIYGFPMTEAIPLGNATTVHGQKAFKGIYPNGVVCTGTLSGSAIMVGHSDVFGLPLFCDDPNKVHGYWDVEIYKTGTFVPGLMPPTPSTRGNGDVRGTWTPPSASDGLKTLVLWQFLSVGDLQPVSAGGFGVNVGMFGMPQAT